ncbi:hypothetical protein JW711_01995 [Candidatus Woesearchaeota archaeon]|nr:hypothetical protein [Candidatus Woesearchaeota archaeon]
MGDFPVFLRPGDDRDILACKFEIEHEDVFHLKNLYKRIYDWMVEEGWAATDGGDKNYETLYWERERPGGIKEHHIWWRAWMTPQGNSYYRYFLKLDYQTLVMKKSEVMSQGMKFSTNKGDVIIRIEAWLQLDYQNKWGKSFLGRWDQWFRKRYYLDNVLKYKQDLYSDIYRLHTMIKQYLQLKPIKADWGRPFHPTRGVA